jgi:pimeloyl-ACP methyl ester carboxylesterase
METMMATSETTTIVLVHGAFADGSGWSEMIPILQEKGFDVIAVQNPLTSLADDVAHTRRAIARAKGPVVLVGHSWGGAVITEAGVDDRVKALVYVAAFAPDAGQSANESHKPFPAMPGLMKLDVDPEGFVTLPADSLAKNFAQDLPAVETAVMAATQGPIHAQCFDTKLTNAAWKTKPSWFIVAEQDRMINPEYLRAAAKRMNAKTTELDTSHVPMASMPEDVADVILLAAEDTADTSSAAGAHR